MNISTQVSVNISETVEKVFDLATNMSRFPDFFKGSGPVPAVQQVTWQSGASPVPGAKRNVHNSDGSVIVEELIQLTRPEKHSYRLISGFKPPFSWMVRAARGDWTFASIGDGTHVDWHYEFELTSPLAWPVTAVIVKLFFRRAMQDCLNAMRASLALN